MKQRGDTIVEVLIAMAVASFILASSYVVVNRTIQNSQAVQEHSEALGIAQGQIEQLQSLASDPDPTKSAPLFAAATPQQCFKPDHTLTAPTQPITSFNSDTNYPDGCHGLGSNNYYRVIIVHTTTPADYFTVYVNWPSITGKGQDQVNLSYKPYHP